jgi:hypothetical protein
MQSGLGQSLIRLCNSIAEFVALMCGGWEAGRTWEFGVGHDAFQQYSSTYIEDEGKYPDQPQR